MDINSEGNIILEFFKPQTLAPIEMCIRDRATMEHADVLYGVTMPEQGISKVLSLRLGDNFNL